MGLIERKKGLIMYNQPQLLTATGNPVNFNTNMSAPMSCSIGFLPKQSGTGNPSPTNVRPISGWTGLDINHYGKEPCSTYAVDWTNEAGTVYGGTLDLATGLLTKTVNFIHFVPRYIIGVVPSSVLNGFDTPYVAASAQLTTSSDEWFESDKLHCRLSGNCGNYEGGIMIFSGGRRLLFGVPSELSTLQAVTDWMTDIGGFDLAFHVANPTTYQLTPQKIKSFIGENIINYTDANDSISVQYWKY